jgi:hypothetical protein
VNSYSLASSPFMAVNSNPLAANQRDSQPCKVTASPFRCAGGLHGIPTNSKSALLETPRVKEHVGWQQEARRGLLNVRRGRKERGFRGGEDGGR